MSDYENHYFGWQSKVKQMKNTGKCCICGHVLESYVFNFASGDSSTVLRCPDCFAKIPILSPKEKAAIENAGYRPICRDIEEMEGYVIPGLQVNCQGGFIGLHPETLRIVGSFIETND